MSDSPKQVSGELVYAEPELQVHALTAIVMAGATGGGDSGFTGFQTFSNGDDFSTEDEEEKDLYSNDW